MRGKGIPREIDPEAEVRTIETDIERALGSIYTTIVALNNAGNRLGEIDDAIEAEVERLEKLGDKTRSMMRIAFAIARQLEAAREIHRVG